MIDEGVGQLVSALKEKGLYENTVIVYTSDHGDYIGHHHMWGKGCFMYDPVIGIPLVIKHAHSEMRGVNDSLSSNLDMAPTLLSLCALPGPAGMRKRNITREGAEYVLAEHMYGDGRKGTEYMLRTDDYKLLLFRDTENIRFYHLKNDPHELCNQARNPAYGAKLTELFQMLVREILFHNHSVQYLDNHAPTVDGRTHEETMLRRAEVAAYSRRMIAGDPDGQ